MDAAERRRPAAGARQASSVPNASPWISFVAATASWAARMRSSSSAGMRSSRRSKRRMEATLAAASAAGSTPVGERVEIDRAGEPAAPHLEQQLEDVPGMDGADHHPVVGRPVAVVEVDAEQLAAPDGHRRRGRRMLAGHQHVAEVEGDAEIRQADVGDSEQRVRHRADQRHPARVARLVLDADPDVRVPSGDPAEAVDLHLPERPVVGLEGVVEPVRSHPQDDMVDALRRGEVDRLARDPDRRLARGGVGMREGAEDELRPVPAQVERGDREPGIFGEARGCPRPRTRRNAAGS